MTKEKVNAVQYAYKLLGYRQRSVKELEDRLRKKGFDAENISDAIKHLLELGYLDDSMFAVSLKESAEKTKCLGSAGARFFLRARGIPKASADEALKDYDEYSAAKRLIEKKKSALRGYSADTARKRLFGYLKRRGFSYDTIRKTLNIENKEET